jgi:hypothetical protein
MQKLIRNDWHRDAGASFCHSIILSHELHPEGLDVNRIRFVENGRLAPKPKVGHIISVLKGKARLHATSEFKLPLQLQAGVHLYLPPGLECVLNAEAGTEFLQVSSPSASQTRGEKMLLRDEEFVAACALGNQALRWIFTPQYLSRRIFLHHDPVLLSKAGNPVSWFRTTMFDVTGLPKNEEGESVFKMSYNSRTEFNVCYDVQGTARVRMAQHPYKKSNQQWGPWFDLNGDSTYHLNEAAGSPEEECCADEATKTQQFLRNKHEVYIINGYVTLFCLFDPAPTGVEKHHPGEYSDYEPIARILGTKLYETHQREIARYDRMIDQLSLAKAMGETESLYGTPIWDLYQQGRESQARLESELADSLNSEGDGRGRLLARWMQPREGQMGKEALPHAADF